MSSSGVPETDSEKKSIKEIIRTGIRIYTKYGIFYFLPNSANRFEFSVLIRKNVGNAVERNYRKRIVREYFKKNKNRLQAAGNSVFLYRYIGKIKYYDLEKELDRKLILK